MQTIGKDSRGIDSLSYVLFFGRKGRKESSLKKHSAWFSDRSRDQFNSSRLLSELKQKLILFLELASNRTRLNISNATQGQGLFLLGLIPEGEKELEEFSVEKETEVTQLVPVRRRDEWP